MKQKYLWLFAGIGSLILVGLIFNFIKQKQQLGINAVADFRTTLSASVASTDTTIYLSKITDRSGQTITQAMLGPYSFWNIEAGGNKSELIACTGISGLSLTGCIRGLPFSFTSSDTGLTSSSTLRKSHNSGSVIIMSNLPQYYKQFVDKDSNEVATGTKRFANNELILGDQTTSTTKYFYFCDSASTSTCGFLYAAPSSTNPGVQTLGYSENGASTFLFSASGTLNASTTKGIFVTDSLVGINASTTGGLSFASNGTAQTIPQSNNASNLGYFGYAFKDIFASGTAYLQNTSLETLTIGSISSNFNPTSNNLYHLGIYGSAWANITASGTLAIGRADSLSTSTFWGNLAIGGSLGTTSTAQATTTIVSNLQVKGNLNVSGGMNGGFLGEFISQTDSTTTSHLTTNVPVAAKFVYVTVNCGGNVNIFQNGSALLFPGIITENDIWINTDNAGTAGGCGYLNVLESQSDSPSGLRFRSKNFSSGNGNPATTGYSVYFFK